MITPMDMVQAIILIETRLQRTVVLEKDSVTERRRLVLLIQVLRLCERQLVHWKEVDGRLFIQRVVVLPPSYHELVVRVYHSDRVLDVAVVKLCEACVQPVVEVTKEETELRESITLQS